MALHVDSAIAQLPNIKRIFIPDPGYTIFDADLSGADAQVVAWEADDDELKALFRSGANVHQHNAAAMFGDRWHSATGHHKSLGTPKGRLYYDCKRAVHATNYVGSARTIAATLGWSVLEAEDFQRRWFRLHPGILDWHERIKTDLRTTHTVRNRCGYHRTYFDRPDSVLPEAIAWIPQSTIAITCFRGALKLEANDPDVQILLQTHDSVTFQIPGEEFRLDRIQAYLQNTIPYPDPLVIQWKIAMSTKSWGDCEEAK